MSKRAKIIIGVVVVLVVIGIVGSLGGNSESGSSSQASEPSQSSAAASSSAASEPAESSSAESEQSKLDYGELLDETTNGGVVVLKAKINSQASNKLTIDQNYYNVVSYINSHDMDGVTELQYWAVADMTSGDESKVISFTVPQEVIEGIQAGNVVTNQLGDYVTDLWVLPSLKA